MAEHEGRRRGHRDGYHERNGGPSSLPGERRSAGFDSRSNPSSHYESHDYEKESSKSRDKEKEKAREVDKSRLRDQDRGRDHDRGEERNGERERDRYLGDHRDRRDKRDRGRDRSDGNDHRRGRDFDRRRDHYRGRDRQHRHRSRSHSETRSGRRSRSHSSSRSKSKRISGFDRAPTTTGLMPASDAGQLPGTMAAVSGLFPNVMLSGQLPTIPMMPVQAMTQQATRHARRVYVGGLSPTANEQSIATFFSQVMAAIGGNAAGPGDAVVNVYINHEKKFAFVEMRSVEEASNAMSLDGIIFEGAPVKVRRPSDYNPSLAAALGPSHPNPNLNLAAVGLILGSSGGLEGPDRIFVGGVPYYFTESQIRELLESFGPLRGFDLVKDRETGNSKGYAFCIYQDAAVTDIACAALNGIKMGDKTLTVRRANQGAAQPRPEQENVLLQAQQQVAMQRQLILQPGILPTKIVCLTQVVSADELKDDEEYENIVEDMRSEGGKYGNLVSIVIPRPNPNGDPTPGVGKVFLEYADVDGSARAKMGLNGRKFDGNQVVAVYYPEDKYAQGNYDG